MNRQRWLVLLLVTTLLGCVHPARLFAADPLPPIQVGKDVAIITKASFLDLMTNHPDKILWIDVRDHSEVTADGTFEQAKVIPIEGLAKEIPNLPNGKPIVFFCSTGSRAGEAYDFLMMKRKDVKAYFLNAEVTFQHKKLPVVTEKK